ncbi:MAG: hypothetical protein U1E35_01045 [Rhodospirillales bacterium]
MPILDRLIDKPSAGDAGGGDHRSGDSRGGDHAQAGAIVVGIDVVVVGQHIDCDGCAIFGSSRVVGSREEASLTPVRVTVTRPASEPPLASLTR